MKASANRSEGAPEPPAGRWPAVTVLVLNYNGWRDTIACLDSLRQLTYPNYRIVVIDNGSSNDSVEMIRAWAGGRLDTDGSRTGSGPAVPVMEIIEYERPTAEAGGVEEEEERFTRLASDRRLVLIRCSGNLGFSAGNNVGIRYALTGDCAYVLLLNNDTCVEPGFLEPLVSACERYPEAVMATGKIFYFDPPSTIWYAGGRMDLVRGGGVHRGIGKTDRGQYDAPGETDFASGCLMLLDRRILTELGLLDERFYLGGEDNILCWKVRRHGYTIRYEPAARIRHRVGASRETIRPRHVYNCYLAKALVMKRILRRGWWLLWYGLFRAYCLTWARYRLKRRQSEQVGSALPPEAFYRAIDLALAHARTKEAITGEDLAAVDRLTGD